MKGFSLRFRIESKLFNGYVIQPIPIVVLTVLVGIAVLYIAVSGTWETLSEMRNPAEYAASECVFTAYRCEGPIYVVTGGDGCRYHLPVKAVDEERELEDLVESKTPVVVIYKLPTDSNTNARDVVEMSGTDGSAIVTKEEIAAANSENTRKALLIVWSVCLAYWGLSIGGYWILCHAPEHPRLAGLLIRREFRNF